MADAESDDVLLSDNERLHALNVLSSHYAAGRLDTGEFYDRSGAVSAARTLRDAAASFAALPGGVPLRVDHGIVRKVDADAAGDPVVTGETTPAEAELASLVRRGRRVEAIDGVIFSATLISFLALQFLLEWEYAWVVWPTLVLTLGIPRLLMKFSDEDEELYEELKESEQEARAERLREAAKRMKELGFSRE